MQAVRYGHHDSGRSAGSNLDSEQEKLVKKVMLAMKDFDIQRGQQDCEATLRETNFDFDKTIDLLISPDYHPWITNPINKGFHKPPSHGGPNPRRREQGDRRPHNSYQKKHQGVKRNESNDVEGSTKPASRESLHEKRKTASDSASKGDDNKKAVHIASKNHSSKGGAESPDTDAGSKSRETSAASKQSATHTPTKETYTAAQNKAEAAAPKVTPVKVVINTKKAADKAATSANTTAVAPAPQGTDQVSKSESTTSTASTTPQKITIKILTSKTAKDNTQQQSAAQKPQGGQKDNIQLTVKPTGGQQAPPIDVMALEKNIGRPAESAPQMAMAQQPYVMAGNIPMMPAPMGAAQQNQQPVQVVYVPVYYSSQGPMGEMNPFPPTTSSQVKNADMFQAPGCQMVHMPMPMMNGMQGQVIAPMQVLPGQQAQHFAFPFTGEAQPQSK